MIRALAITLCVVLFSTAAFTQGIKLPPTKSFTVTGKIESPKTINDTDLLKLPVHKIGDLEIINHKGEAKAPARKLSGVLLKDILAGVVLETDNPKLFSEFYFVCKATDGYKVVYSWNELFNTRLGNAVYIITSKDKKTLTELDESILMISTQDVRRGRRYLKNLESIYVGRAE